MYRTLKEIRERLHLSQSYVANFLNCSINDLDLMENGKKIFPDTFLNKMCFLYGINKEDILKKEMLNNEDSQIIQHLISFKEQYKKRKNNNRQG